MATGLSGHLAGKHCVNGVTEPVEEGRVFLRNLGIELSDGGLGNHHVLRERPIGIDADDFYVLADMRFARAALQALATGHVHFARDEIALLDTGDFVAESHHLAAELMTRN